MDRQRLLRLAILLEDYRARTTPSFDLQSWGAFETRAGGFLWLEQRSCNTAACAIGLACTSGMFADDGMSYQRDDDGRLTPLFHDLDGWDAVKAFFDLEHDQAVRLFAEHSYEVTTGEPAARAVAARIREMIAQIETAAQPA
jgi:hypothetical protein